jgi:hypothetical protein
MTILPRLRTDFRVGEFYERLAESCSPNLLDLNGLLIISSLGSFGGTKAWSSNYRSTLLLGLFFASGHALSILMLFFKLLTHRGI